MNNILKKARQIYQKYGNCDLELIVDKLKAKLFEYPLGKVVKEVYFKDLKAIVVDSDLHPYRKRHLISHALGHHLFHGKRKANYFVDEDKNLLDSVKIRVKENEAERFAAYLLIPEARLRAALKEEWVAESQNPIQTLADEFQVPEELMRKRLEFK